MKNITIVISYISKNAKNGQGNLRPGQGTFFTDFEWEPCIYFRLENKFVLENKFAFNGVTTLIILFLSTL